MPFPCVFPVLDPSPPFSLRNPDRYLVFYAPLLPVPASHPVRRSYSVISPSSAPFPPRAFSGLRPPLSKFLLAFLSRSSPLGFFSLISLLSLLVVPSSSLCLSLGSQHSSSIFCPCPLSIFPSPPCREASIALVSHSLIICNLLCFSDFTAPHLPKLLCSPSPSPDQLGPVYTTLSSYPSPTTPLTNKTNHNNVGWA
uniref:Uncharacterized protein n=1 Tax=Knipowitschia caucasica TaxID=637954 RepID=A0AAV2L8E2_KNICA